MTSGHRAHPRRKAGTGAPASVPSYVGEDDMIRATITSPTGRAYIQQTDGTLRMVEGVPLPASAPLMLPASPNPLQAVINEFPEVGQPGTRAHHRFHRAFRKAGSHPEHALHVARAVLR